MGVAIVTPGSDAKGLTARRAVYLPKMSTFARARALAFGMVTAAFSLLFLFITIRVALTGDFLNTLLTAALTAALIWGTVRWYRRFRRASFM